MFFVLNVYLMHEVDSFGNLYLNYLIIHHFINFYDVYVNIVLFMDHLFYSVSSLIFIYIYIRVL